MPSLSTWSVIAAAAALAVALIRRHKHKHEIELPGFISIMLSGSAIPPGCYFVVAAFRPDLASDVLDLGLYLLAGGFALLFVSFRMMFVGGRS